MIQILFALRRRAVLAAVFVLASTVMTSVPAAAQPFGAWFTMAGHPMHGYIRIPHSAALNPTNRFTFEAWVSVTDSSGGCKSIAGKGFSQAWWVGICGTTLRSYLKGSTSRRDGGVVPPGWTHVAVVFNGTRRMHYVNGELVLNVPETGPLTTSTSEMRIGSDDNFQFTPSGAIDEVRLWNVARTQAQIRQFINRRINAPQTGLVGVWALDGNGNDSVGGRNGTQQGTGTGFLTFPAGGSCSNSGKYFCFHNRFLVNADYRTGGPGTSETGADPVDSTLSSGVFSFPNAEIWQILMNVINACSTSGKFTVAISTPSTLFERINVFDTVGFENKIYFHYPGAPSAPIVDTSAFSTCP